MPRRVRVVVSTFDRLHLLRRAARAYLRQTFQDFAVTVADDGSGPETAAFVRQWAAEAPFPVDHVRQPHDGFRKAAILNEAVRRSDGEPLLLFTDGDCVPPARFVELHAMAHVPRSFQVGGMAKIDREHSEALTEADVDAGRHEALVTAVHRRVCRRWAIKSRFGVALHLRRRPKAIGTNIGIDRGLYEEINGFDEAFVGWGGEDDDLRDRAMATRPRPRVRLLFGRCDTIHLWHPPAETKGLELNRAHWKGKRPVRCLRGLVDETGRTTRKAAMIGR